MPTKKPGPTDPNPARTLPPALDAIRARGGQGDAPQQALRRYLGEAHEIALRLMRAELPKEAAALLMTETERRLRAALRPYLLPAWRTHDPDLARAGVEPPLEDDAAVLP